MKTNKLFLPILFIAFSLMGCAQIFAKRVSGNGQVVVENRELPAFNAVKIDGAMNVVLRQAKSSGVKVEADENIQDYIEVFVKEGCLVVDIQKGIRIRSCKKKVVHVSVNDLSSIKNDGVGNISCANDLHLARLEVKNDGVGNLHLQGTVDYCEMKNDGVGNIDAADFIAHTLVVRNDGVGNVHVTATEELEVKHDGVGNIVYGGEAKLIDIDSDGVGKVKKRD